MVTNRLVVLYTDEDGVWCAECPSLPGCFSNGETQDEARANIQDAIKVYIEALEQDNLPVPEDDAQIVVTRV